MSRLLAHVGLAVVSRTDAGDIGRHVFATFAERHDVVDLRVDGSVRIPEHRMLAPWGLVARYRYRRTAICYWRDPADGRQKRPSNTFMKMELGGHPTIRPFGPSGVSPLRPFSSPPAAAGVAINRAATVRCHARSVPMPQEGARNVTDREGINGRLCSGCAHFNDRVRELRSRGVRCD
jgi:hypothetical protein